MQLMKPGYSDLSPIRLNRQTVLHVRSESAWADPVLFLESAAEMTRIVKAPKKRYLSDAL